MSSFKIQKGTSARDQAKGAGVLIAILGVLVAILAYSTVGWIMVVLGLLVFAASFAASE